MPSRHHRRRGVSRPLRCHARRGGKRLHAGRGRRRGHLVAGVDDAELTHPRIAGRHGGQHVGCDGGRRADAAAGDPIYTLVVGGSGNPIPSPAYISNVVSKFVAPYFPVDPALVQGLFTPAQFYIDTGIKTLPLNVSVPQGVAILTNTLVGTNPPYLGLLTSGNTVNVTGDSQSAMIASLVMRALNPTNSGAAGSPYFDDLTFSLFGNPMNPNGGLFARFPGLSLPSMGLDFYGSTPDNSFPTNVFTLEYDGAADFPRYPINFLADLNAFLGIQSLHGQYPSLTPNSWIPQSH